VKLCTLVAENGVDSPKAILLQFAAFALLSAAVVSIVHFASRMTLFASPSACLREYVRAVLALDEARELRTATEAARAKAKIDRGPDAEKRMTALAGKARIFRNRLLRWTPRDVKVWAERARITVTMGERAGRPCHFTYTFLLEKEAWKITNIEEGRDWDFR
jgi:hypothetical protein